MTKRHGEGQRKEIYYTAKNMPWEEAKGTFNPSSRYSNEL
jgi:hypothetical protein